MPGEQAPGADLRLAAADAREQGAGAVGECHVERRRRVRGQTGSADRGRSRWSDRSGPTNQVAGPGRTTTLMPGGGQARATGSSQPENASNASPANPMRDLRRLGQTTDERSIAHDSPSPRCRVRARKFVAILMPPYVDAALPRAARTPMWSRARKRPGDGVDYNRELSGRPPPGGRPRRSWRDFGRSGGPTASRAGYNALFARTAPRSTAGRPALQGREPGQVRKEAATAIHCKCRGNGSPPFLLRPAVVARTASIGYAPVRGAGRGPAAGASGIGHASDRQSPMSYQVLARKWRPRHFAELVGQEHVVTALDQRADARPPASRLPADRHARRGQDDASRASSPRASTARPGVTATPCGVCAACTRHRRRPLRRPPRARRGVEHRRRQHARDPRQRALRADRRALQGLPDRRSAHAVEGGVQLDAEDARGAAGARQVRARHDRSAEDPGHGAVALPAVQPEAAAARR